MQIRADQYSETDIAKVLHPLGTGALIGSLAALLMSALPEHWTIFILAALVVLLPTFLVKDARLYWLSAYLVLLPLEGNRGKNITKYFFDASEITETLGMPSAGQVGITVSPSDMVLFGLLSFWLLQILRAKENLHLPRVSFLALAYLTWATLSAALKAPYPYLSIVELYQEYKYFLVYLYAVNAVDPKRHVSSLISVLMFCLVVQGAAVFTSAFVGRSHDPLSFLFAERYAQVMELPNVYEDVYEKKGEGKRASGTITGPGSTAMYLHFLIPLALARGLIIPDVRGKWSSLVLLAIGVTAVYLTNSRGAFIGMVGALTVLLCLALRRELLSKKQLISMIVCGAVLVLPIAMPVLYSHFTTRVENITNRIPLVEKGVRLIGENPFLGVGPNNSTAVKKKFKDDAEGEWLNPVHDYYIILAADTGLVGLALYLAFFGSIVSEAFRTSQSRVLDISCLSLGIFGTYVALATHLIADGLDPEAKTMLWFYAGLTMALGRSRRSESSPPGA